MMEDAPPPPYTETDIYSRSGRSPAARAGSNDDATSVTESSSRGTPVYTPPETPRESQFNFSGIEDHRTIASARFYFESRPTLVGRASDQSFVTTLAVTEDASPDEFPYPGWAREHDTTEQDWQTFLNYLLPDHAARSNSQTIDRKLQAEDDAKSFKTERGIAEAQLGQIKSSSDLPLRPAHDIDAMVREWNDGFFGPRGVTVQRTPLSSPSVSGARAAEDPPTSVPQPQPQPQSQPQSQEQASRSRWNPFRPFDVSGRGIRIGRLSIDDDRVSFGDSFEVDRNGVRWNGLSTSDLRFEPDNGGRGDVPRGPGPFNGFPPGGRGGFGDHGMGRGRGGRWWNAGQSQHHPHVPHSDHSPGPRSSASSSSGSGSDSSIGSLPEWDDLRDSQLSVTKQSISAWLAHPEQPVTKSMLRGARAEIKAARHAPPPAADADPAWHLSKQAQRQEVRALLARLKDLKREQRKASRAARKDRKDQKRALRRDRRDRRKAEKRDTRDLRQAERGARRAPFDPFNAPHGPPAPGPHPPGFFGADAFYPPGRGARGGRWQDHVQNAHRQADLARAQAAEQAARAQAQAGSARALALSQAQRTCADAQRQANAAKAQAERTRADAQRQSNAARAQAQATAAAAVAGWGSSVPDPYSQSHVYPPEKGAAWGGGNDGGIARGGVGNASGSGGGSGSGNSNNYETADALEAQIAAKTSALLGLHETIQMEQIEAARRGEGDVKGKSKTETEAEAEKLEEEIENLGRDVQRLRLEADEEMARKMAEEDRWWGR
ncbi:hypothetical protein F4781DRAFT_224700 [Annulohypoxylon bovei var. microspora]|nr:hypothetical protein F4781DRAFT_224700 [Annulohypoxylon bovei var. microspora]